MCTRLSTGCSITWYWIETEITGISHRLVLRLQVSSLGMYPSPLHTNIPPEPLNGLIISCTPGGETCKSIKNSNFSTFHCNIFSIIFSLVCVRAEKSYSLLLTWPVWINISIFFSFHLPTTTMSCLLSVACLPLISLQTTVPTIPQFTPSQTRPVPS